MTPQEQQLLMSLTQRVNQTRLQEKDPDAQNLLGRELGANPDAIYILAQTVLVQNFALEQARAQVTQLQQQLQQAQEQPAHTTSFLGSLFGRHDSEPQQQQTSQFQPGQPQPYQPVQQYQSPQAPPYQPVPQYQAPAQQGYYPPPQQPQYVQAPGGQPSFLRGAMTTAAGVAAGALAFEGIESVLHGFGHGGGYGPGMAGFGMGPGSGLGGGFERPVEETVVNNYYEGSGPSGRDPNDGTLRGFEGGNDQGFRESGDRFSDASYETQDIQNSGSDDGGRDALLDDSAAYDTSADDVQLDDDGGMDDGGGFDDNSSGF